MNVILKHALCILKQNKINRETDSKLTKIAKNIDMMNRDIDREAKYSKLWSRFGVKVPVGFLRCMVSISGIDSYEYVPENIYYGKIEPVLNNRLYAFAYNDKNFFERYLSDYKEVFPDAIIRSQYGMLYSGTYKALTQAVTEKVLAGLLTNSEYILKPSIETGGGSNVILVKKLEQGLQSHENTYSVRQFIDILKTYNRGNAIFQKKIEQHEWFKRFNESSVNTLRMYVYRSVADDVVHLLSSYIRFGREGSVVDSSSQGGFTCGVGLDGITNSFVINKYGKIFSEQELNKKHICGIEVPNFSNMIGIAKGIAPWFTHQRLLGFDFSIDNSGRVVLIEVNNYNVGVINQQMNNGPLFKSFTKEIVDYCTTHERAYSYGFYMR